MKFSRRQFVACSLALGMPQFAVAQDAAGFVILTAEKSTMPLLSRSGPKTAVWRFLKEQPIAELRAKQGQEFKGRIINRLNQDLWLHWFGVRGASTQMTLNVLPGDANAVEFAFTPPDAGTFWFGPMTQASEQRDMGLYGMLIVEEAAALSPGFNDVPLIFDDWMIDDQGRSKGQFGDLETAIGEGRIGDWFTANGIFKSKIKIDRSKPARLRILNAANARVMNITFSGGGDLLLMALDGQPVPPKPLAQGILKLYPGQRADLLLADVKNEIVVALDVLDSIVEIAYLEPFGTSAPAAVPENFALPANPLSVLGDLAASRHIPIVIEGGAKGGLQSAKVGDKQLDMRGLLEKGLAWAFNGIAGVGGPPLFEVKKGETLVLDISNKTSFPQPVHIHGHVWRLIESDGQAIEAAPFMDTAIIPGLSSSKLAFVADNVGLWVLQSLVAERVDSGLIGAFSVLAAN